MKYIRTKDEKIYRISQGIFGGYPIDKAGNVLRMPFAKCDIVSQADTIEELIDCYVVICEHQDKPLNVCKNEIEHYKHCLVDKVKSNNRVLAIYGSIWVGADLISQAKMSEEGKLELL